MSATRPKLANPPIVEAVLDFDCDLPPNVQLAALEAPAKERYSVTYPKFKIRHVLEHEFRDISGETPKASMRKNVDGFMFLEEDEKQLVQVRAQGFSFNRLAPYSTLDDYLPEVGRAWSLYSEFAKPVLITSIRLRYINKILIPLIEDPLDLDEYLKFGPRLHDEERLAFKSFLSQYVAVEKETGHEVKVILTSQSPENGKLPIIFDITASSANPIEPIAWEGILSKIQSLRGLTDGAFFSTLEEKCLQLFQ